MKPFEKWKTQEVKQTFGLEEVEKSMIWQVFVAIKQVKLYIEENYQKIVGK